MYGAQHSQLLPPISAGKGGSEHASWENPGVSKGLGLGSGTSSWWPSRSHSILHHLIAAPQECPVRLNPSKSLSGMCNESMSSYWYHVVLADVHSPWAPHSFHPSIPVHKKPEQDRMGQRQFRWQQMEHTEVFWLGQTLSAIKELGGLVLPPSVGTS